MKNFLIEIDCVDNLDACCDLNDYDLHIVECGDFLTVRVHFDTSSRVASPENLCLLSDWRCEGAAEFRRNEFQPLPFSVDANCAAFRECRVPLATPGTFRFFASLVAKPEQSTLEQQLAHRCTKVFGIVVQPAVKIERENGRVDEIRVRDVVMQTVLTKCLGPLSRWSSQLSTLDQHGFNAVHFTPLATLGRSNSAYSLADQLTFDKRFEIENEEALRNTLQTIERQSGVIAMVDVVLNHTADNTEWLKEHPDAVYNTDNSPHLVKSFFSCCICKKKSHCSFISFVIICLESSFVFRSRIIEILCRTFEFRKRKFGLF